jgi:hypothetical protein
MIDMLVVLVFVLGVIALTAWTKSMLVFFVGLLVASFVSFCWSTGRRVSETAVALFNEILDFGK